MKICFLPPSLQYFTFSWKIRINSLLSPQWFSDVSPNFHNNLNMKRVPIVFSRDLIFLTQIFLRLTCLGTVHFSPYWGLTSTPTSFEFIKCSPYILRQGRPSTAPWRLQLPTLSPSLQSTPARRPDSRLSSSYWLDISHRSKMITHTSVEKWEAKVITHTLFSPVRWSLQSDHTHFTGL